MSDEAYQRARRQVRAMRGFYKHLSIYLLVIGGLACINLMSPAKKAWFLFPAFGWGIGLAMHALKVWGGELWLGREWEEKKIEQLLAKEKIRTLSTEKQLVEARMRLLQAQIEPHFLFNTLANVVSLITPAPAKAQLMLETFIAYLRGSLAASRSTQGSFAQEKELLKHYLDLLKIRMGERLDFSLDFEPSVLSEPLAPMLLQPIVENAIRHGLEPKVEGGKLTVEVIRINAQIQVRITDDGLGFKPGPLSGIGLENLRERLAVLYEGEADMQVEAGPAGVGTNVTLKLPSRLKVRA